MENGAINSKVDSTCGSFPFILAALYLGELLFNLDNPYFNDADAIELIVKSITFFLLLGGP